MILCENIRFKELYRIISQKRIDAKTEAEDKYQRALQTYALELLDKVRYKDGDQNMPITYDMLLDGSPNWYEYSKSGKALTSDLEIAQRYLLPEVIKLLTKPDGTITPPQSDFITLQAYFLFIACENILFLQQDLADWLSLKDARIELALLQKNREHNNGRKQ